MKTHVCLNEVRKEHVVMRWSIFLASGGLAKRGNVMQICEQCMYSVLRTMPLICQIACMKHEVSRMY